MSALVFGAFGATGLAADYLPLVSGNSWTLKHSSGLITTLTVSSAELIGQTRRARVDFTTPYSSYSFLLLASSGDIKLEGLAQGDKVYRYSEPSVFFPVGSTGQTWTSPVATVVEINSNSQIKTPSKTYTNCRGYRITWTTGEVQTWWLAPNTGFVRMGDAPYNFDLSAVTLKTAPSAAPLAAVSGTCPRIGIDPNPAANGDFSAAGKTAAATFAQANGARLLDIEAKWSDLEPQPGVYALDDLKQRVAMAESLQFDVSLTLKTADTFSRTVPSDLANTAWNSAAMTSRFQAMEAAVSNVMGMRLKWVHLANEVDPYFMGRMNELPAFGEFYTAGAATWHALRPGVSVGVVFAYDSYRLSNEVFLQLAPLMDHIAFTYYALNGYTARDPDVAPLDIADMLHAAGARQLVLNEVGYCTAALAGGSTDRQSRFFSNVFAALAKSSGHVAATRFYQMSDLPPAWVQAYAGPSGATAASAYVGSLGLFDTAGIAKPAWSVFQQQAGTFAANVGCTQGSVSVPQ